MPVTFEGYGNLLNCNEEVIVCPIDTASTMCSGISLCLRNEVMGLYTFYKSLQEMGDLYVGTVHIYNCPNSDRKIVLFPIRHGIDKPLSLEDISLSLDNLVSKIQGTSIESLAISSEEMTDEHIDYFNDLKPLFMSKLSVLDAEISIYNRETTGF